LSQPVLQFESGAASASRDNLARRTAHGFVWLMAQTVGSKIVGMGGQVILAWLLTPDDFGLWGSASIVMGFSGLIQQAGLRETLIHRQRTYHLWANTAFWMSVGLGLLGAFLIEPKDPLPIEKADGDFVFVLNDGAHGYTFNGKSFPATDPLVAKLGQKIRIRFMNEGMMIHPMHLHGMHMTVIAKDGWPVPAPWKCDTLNVAPGERWDVIVNCNNPGTWAFHCHILPHAESAMGMFGMVTALVVQK